MITLGVKDLKASTAFYKNGLGLPLNDQFDGISFFTLNGTWLSLYPLNELAADAKVPAARTGFGGITMAHNVESKEKVDEIIKKAEKAGAVVTDPPHDRDWGGYSGYFADPDGYLWEIAWNPGLKIGG
ncbi:MAG: hypothetical protein RI947_427 [Candidatus Parcubacteria bacterium]|jgi:catechol 2,3-dioxygenase-like lactoylglutathione lyase family enzyme